MGEFDDALGRILGDPSAMAQIAKLAQSLGGGDSPPSASDAPPDSVPPPPPLTHDRASSAGDSPPRTPSSVPDGPSHAPSSVGDSPPRTPPSVPDGPSHAPSSVGDSSPAPPVPGLSDLAGLVDSPLVRRLLPLLLEGRQNSEARRFLYALRPYLSQRRQENVERALQMARLIRVGRRFLSDGQGGGPA